MTHEHTREQAMTPEHTREQAMTPEHTREQAMTPDHNRNQATTPEHARSRSSRPRAAPPSDSSDHLWLLLGGVILLAFIPAQVFAVPRLYTAMGEYHESRGKRLDAVKAYDRVLAVWPRLFDADEVMFRRAVLLMSPEKDWTPRFADAEADLRGVLASQPDNADVHFNLGLLVGELLDGGARAAEAEPHLRNALALGDPLPEHQARRLNALGKLLSNLGRHDEANHALEQALELQPGSAVLHVSLANALHAAGDLERAIVAYRLAIDQVEGLDEDEAMYAYNNFAAALQEHGDLMQARRMYERAIALSPKHKTALVNLNKLPVSDVYRAAASYEIKILAHRAALTALAAAAERRSGRHTSALATPPDSPSSVKADAGAGRAANLANLANLDRSEEPMAEAPMAVRLFRTIHHLRRLETEQTKSPTEETHSLWNSRGLDVHSALSASGRGDDNYGEGSFSLKAFAWGGVWYQSAWLPACTAHPESRAAISRATLAGKSAVVLGSSIGFEAYFAALTFGLPTVGVELLCSLVELSEHVRLAHRVPDDVVRFECADALKWDLPSNVGLVYVDDTAWDKSTIEQLAIRLGLLLPEGTLIIHNGGETAYGQVGRLRRVQSIKVKTSWSEAHTIVVHEVGA